MEGCEDPEAPYEPRGNAWSNCGGVEGVSEPMTEEIPVEMTATEEEETDQAGDNEKEEDETEEKETEELETPESSSFSMELRGVACVSLLALLTIAL